MDPSSPASACAMSPEFLGAEVQAPADLRYEVAREIAKVWISRTNRIPRFCPPPPDPHEDELERVLMALRGPGILELLTTLNARVLHPFVTTRRMIADARALGLSTRLARRLLAVFRRAWGVPPLAALTYADQVERVALLLCSGGALDPVASDGPAGCR